MFLHREIFFDSHKVFKVVPREHCICYFVSFEDSCSVKLSNELIVVLRCFRKILGGFAEL